VLTKISNGNSSRLAIAFGLALALVSFAGCRPESQRDPSFHEESERQSGAPRGAAKRYDLARDEARTDDELRERLVRERNISAASTWTDRETAETVVAETLAAERSRVESWVQRGFPRPNLALHYNAGRVVGRSLRRGDAQTVYCTSAVIVLRADGPESFFVLTTYPEARQ
jgi:hypothetical protein